MPMKNACLKVLGGKMLRITLSLSENEIKRLSLHGDFFIHPENSVEMIEDFFKGKDISDLYSMESNFSSLLIENKIRIVGFSFRDICEAVRIAANV